MSKSDDEELLSVEEMELSRRLTDVFTRFSDLDPDQVAGHVHQVIMDVRKNRKGK